jgi:hypothetical protein
MKRPEDRALILGVVSRRALVKMAVLFGLLHYSTLLLLSGLIFLLSHVPPKAINLDNVILILHSAQAVLVAPRRFLLWLWPGEFTPEWLGLTTTVLNSIVWGGALAGLRILWRKLTTY